MKLNSSLQKLVICIAPLLISRAWLIVSSQFRHVRMTNTYANNDRRRRPTSSTFITNLYCPPVMAKVSRARPSSVDLGFFLYGLRNCSRERLRHALFCYFGSGEQ